MTKPELTNDGLKRLQDAMAKHVQGGDVPGMVYALSRGEELHVNALGTKSAHGAGGAMQRDTIFRISSMTKPIVGVATLMLVEHGKLQLDEPVDRLLPELRDRRVLARADGPLDDTVPAKRAITTRDLLTLTFGFGQMIPKGPLRTAATERKIGMGPPEPAKALPPDEWLRALGSLPLAYQPGQRWEYNTGSDVLGVLIARASGQSLGTFLRERIFEPLGMRSTGFSVPASELERFADSYGVDASGKLELFDSAKDSQWSRPPAFESGAGGLCSTVDDFLAFARVMLHGGERDGVRLISRASFEAMTTDELTPAQKKDAGPSPGFFDTHGWGFGVGIATSAGNPAEPLGSFGWSGGLGTSWSASPSERMTTVFLAQRMFTSPEPPAHLSDFETLAHAAIAH